MNLETKDIIKEEIKHKIKSCLNEIQDYLEIELNKSKETLLNQWLEIERLNNIINVLEKWTWYYQDQVIKDKGQYAQDMLNQSYYEGKIDGIQGIIDKLKELKENK